MQQALQNPHYKKICEKVIMNRHPEAKSLVEALEMESNERYCQYMLTDNDNFIVDGDYISKYYHHNNNYQILGRPITLFDILMLLNKNSTYGAYITDGFTIQEVPHGIVCDFASNLLEEQTPETWKKISNLID